jgi:hypothetical protein
MTMEVTKDQLLAEVRYAQRLCQRTARLYRRASACFTFLSLVAASGAIASLSAQLPVGVTVGLAITFAVFGAINHAMRPAEKIAANDSDVRKYSALLAKAVPVTDVEIIKAMIAEARQSDVPEVEPLRDVAYNDVMLEINRPDALIPLRFSQRLLGALA